MIARLNIVRTQENWDWRDVQRLPQAPEYNLCTYREVDTQTHKQK